MSLDANIAFTIAAARRHQDATAAMFPFVRGTDVCCPRCKWGARLRAWDERQARRLSWLAVLLQKRAAPGDTDIAHAIKSGAWP